MSGKKKGLQDILDDIKQNQDISLAFDGSFVNRFKSVESLTFLDSPLLEIELVGNENVRTLKEDDSLKIDTLLRNVKKHVSEEGFVVQVKLVNDPIYGTITLHPLAVVMMNTPQFQRLHHVRQLSTVHYVYPSASYSRFEHSIGTYHLAGTLINTIRDKQPELNITAIDAMCVQLAGLCHDIGHGPFSHLFERYVVPKLKDKPANWSHENASMDMVEKIWEENKGKFEVWGFCEEDKNFIKALIRGKSAENEKNGRGEDKDFLYEIVSNSESGMDVDKWDYLVRDSYHLGIKCAFEQKRLIHHLRVINGSGGPRICYRAKEADTIFTMFQTRYTLYKKAYQHPVAIAIDQQVAEAMIKASDSLRIGPQGMKMGECLGNMDAYLHLHDGIFFKILEDPSSEDSKMKEAQELLENLQKRKLWKCCGKVLITGSKKKIEEKFMETMRKDHQKVKTEELKFFKSKRNLGLKEKNPLDCMWFYDKGKPDTRRSLLANEKDYLRPEEFQHKFLGVYCTSPNISSKDYEELREIVQRVLDACIKEVTKKDIQQEAKN